MGIVEAHRLAQLIETIHARDRAAVRRGPGRARVSWEDEYDPLAATCLGDLIYQKSNYQIKRIGRPKVTEAEEVTE